LLRTEKQYLSRIILAIYCSFTVFVLGYLVYNSFRSKRDILSNTLGFPKELSLNAYIDIFKSGGFHYNILSSVIILIGSICLLILLSSMVAYGIGVYTFKFKRFIMVYFLLGLMFPVQLGIVPIFLTIKNMGLINSVWGVILIMGAGISVPVILLTNFFANSPRSIYEAAKIDGAGEWTIFYRVMFPVASPIIVSLSIVSAVGIWNNFFIPLVLLQNENVKTIPLAIMKYTNNIIVTVDQALATSVLATIPILILFFIFSNKIIDSVATGGVKE
jgi:raffinose/stachyose/melibiose transport system permease protein